MICPKCGTKAKGYPGVKNGLYCPKCQPEIQEIVNKRMAKARFAKKNKKAMRLLNKIYEEELSK